MKKITIFSFFILMAMQLQVKGQCLMTEVPLAERTKGASLIVEGKVISQRSYWNESHSLIMTAHEIEVYKIFKGKTSAETITLVTEGGQIGNLLHTVRPSAELSTGDVGVFMLEKVSIASKATPQFTLFSSAQGVIRYDLEQESAADPFRRYASIEKNIYGAISKVTGKNFLTFKNLQNPVLKKQTGDKMLSTQAASVTEFLPAIVMASQLDTLTIKGSGFGNTKGNITFKNADDGGKTNVTTPSKNILSWKDNEIRLIVPYKAGSGPVLINGTPTTKNVTIGSSYMTVADNRTETSFIVNTNKTGGYTYQFNSGFAAHAPAAAAFMRALETWRCNAGINFNIALQTTDISSQNYDQVNIVTFVSNGSLGSGVLGKSYSYNVGCKTGSVEEFHMEENDLVFVSTSTDPWNFGPGTTQPGRQDFESVVLHEIGHSIQLGHVNDETKVMTWKMGGGKDWRTVSAGEIYGAKKIIEYSKHYGGCDDLTPMVGVRSVACKLEAPRAVIHADVLKGMAPFTVQFSDTSENSPLIWEWDVDNNGTIDYTIPSPTHTYTQPGKYSVKLNVKNYFGNNSAIKTQYITVLEVLHVSAGENSSVCLGDSVELAGSASGGSGSFTYNWSPKTGLSDPTHQNPVAKPTETTEYTLTVKDVEGAENSASVIVEVMPLPDKPEIVQDGNLLISTTAAEYQWVKNDTIINGAATQSLIPPSSGKYKVKVTNENGCSAISDVYEVQEIPNSVYDDKSMIHSGVWPNPCNETSAITYSLASSATVKIRIVNNLGQDIFSQELLKQDKGEYTYQLNCGELASGVYLIRVETGYNVHQRIFIK
ncbi:MAG TPA: PKD domain-containing protein [Patescibacteria group bacterium]|nr:PKD domain-containing protein [Patescibacteria group bacterium]